MMFQLVILQEDTLSLDFFGQIADRFVVREGFLLMPINFTVNPLDSLIFSGLSISLTVKNSSRSASLSFSILEPKVSFRR